MLILNFSGHMTWKCIATLTSRVTRKHFDRINNIASSGQLGIMEATLSHSYQHHGVISYSENSGEKYIFQSQNILIEKSPYYQHHENRRIPINVAPQTIYHTEFNIPHGNGPQTEEADTTQPHLPPSTATVEKHTRNHAHNLCTTSSSLPAHTQSTRLSRLGE